MLRCPRSNESGGGDMSDRDRDRDRPKKSWRDVDAQRDRSGGTQPRRTDQPPRARHEEERSSKQYRAALDAMFEKGEVGKLAEKLINQNRAPSALREMPQPKPAAPPPEAAAEAKAAEAKEDPRQILRKKVLSAVGRDEISRVFDRYVKAYGLPKDFELLEQGLEHNKDERLSEVMDAVAELLTREKPKRSRTLAGKLRFIEETSSDSELRTKAAAVRAKLG